jgi:cytochrome c oxidase cbb3-type subunit 2
MWDPKSLVPDSIMPAYKHQFTNAADVATAYAEAVTVKNVFGTPYGDEIAAGQEAFEKHLKAKILPEALKVAKEMKNDKLVKMVEEGKVPEVVALTAYLNRLK